MKYLIDSGNIKAIEHISEFYPIEGVTTNPTLVSKEKTDFLPLIKKIRSIIGEDAALHVQTTAKTAEDILEEARGLKKAVGGQFYVKIPINEEGLKAASMIKAEGIGVTMTAIFTSQQALIAARAGADFVAPYVNRLDNINADGVGTVAEIAELFDIYSLDCKVLAASFKNVKQISETALAGAHCATISPELFRQAISHPMTDNAIEGFERDWKSVYGEKGVGDFLL
ncbi:MAG: fructose-6-phosphate aldolase [Clostridia bacterium]|nr:fructose-6-phosphate aldolase [Clostridia bacterium]